MTDLPPLAKAIDKYIELRGQQEGQKEKIDPRLQSIIENLFLKCIADREYKQARILSISVLLALNYLSRPSELPSKHNVSI